MLVTFVPFNGDTHLSLRRQNVKKTLLAISLLVGSGGFSAAHALEGIDPDLSEYAKASGVSGNISSVGSDTLANLMTLWTEEFKRLYPNVNIQVQAAGSSTAPPALTEGTSNFGPMSRKMKDKEIEAFEKKHGYKPTAVPSPSMPWQAPGSRIAGSIRAPTPGCRASRRRRRCECGQKPTAFPDGWQFSRNRLRPAHAARVE